MVPTKRKHIICELMLPISIGPFPAREAESITEIITFKPNSLYNMCPNMAAMQLITVHFTFR